MEARETVMTIPAIREHFKGYPQIKDKDDLNKMFRSLTEAQAEISFKAGEKQGYEKGYKVGYEQARQELLRWARDNTSII